MKEEFKTRLARALTLKEIKPIVLAEKSGLPKSGISQYLKGVCVPKNKNILKIAEVLEINPDWLLGNSDIMENPITKSNSLSSNLAVVMIYGKIPAGIPMECIEDIIDTEEISADMLKGGKQYFGLKVNGHSMETKYLDGDILILEKIENCENGDDCVVMVNGNEGTFKRIIKDEEKQTISLQPLNTSLDENGMPLYETKTYTKEEIEKLPVKIIGKVVELRRKIKR